MKTLDATEGHEKVAGHHEERRAAGGGQLLLQRRHARQAAEAVDRDHRVDVVHLQEGDGRLDPRPDLRRLRASSCILYVVSGFSRTDRVLYVACRL